MPKTKRFLSLDSKRNHAIAELASLAMDHLGATKRLREVMDICRNCPGTPSDSTMQSARDIQTVREKLEFAMTGVALDMQKLKIGFIGANMVEQHIEYANEIMRRRP